MQQKLDELKAELTQRVHTLFIEKFDGKQREFARAVGCDEKIVRKLFRGEQGMTVNLLFKMAAALKVKPVDLLEGLSLGE
ncbi:helix-turn-helix domain-containing protein [Flavobacterium sp. 3HN19-14]|uniref:helix-turn-helix domain-containing protein n=1 Tax=Flavobacterium sp. 3HN19-14 TaxID=3448133 RepID=UPI003EE04409